VPRAYPNRRKLADRADQSAKLPTSLLGRGRKLATSVDSVSEGLETGRYDCACEAGDFRPNGGSAPLADCGSGSTTARGRAAARWGCLLRGREANHFAHLRRISGIVCSVTASTSMESPVLFLPPVAATIYCVASIMAFTG
jgi:hypothetical protein